MLHVVVPLMAVIGWVAFGPRFRITARTILAVTIWPIAYMIGVAVYGEIANWYAYPFIDVSKHGYPTVILTGVVILAFLLALAGIAAFVDRLLPTGRFDELSAAGTTRQVSPAGG
ncbi:MAG TPA: Pr6Pr family membrane protein [Actinopolymorphaceae bacterium]